MKKSHKGLLVLAVPFLLGFLAGYLVRGGCGGERDGAAVEETAASRGILSTTAALLAAVQGTEAMKILMHGPGHESVRRTLLYINLIDNCFEQRAVARLAGCEVCGGGQNGN